MATALFFSRDPGPTNFLVALHDMLFNDAPRGPAIERIRSAVEATDCKPLVLAREPGAQIWAKASISFATADFRPHEAEVADLLDRLRPDLILTGASDIDEETDRLLWRCGARMNIPSHAILDHPANIARRFKLADGSASIPDWVYAPDDEIARMAVEAGINADRVSVIGWIHHDRMRRSANAMSKSRVVSLRQLWGAQDDDIVVLFASECASEMKAAGREPLYSEFEALEHLIAIASLGGQLAGQKLDSQRTLIVVRPHPRDTAGKYARYETFAVSSPRVTVSSAEAPEVALFAADVTAGMNSSMLYEAVTLGRPVASLVGADLTLKPRALV